LSCATSRRCRGNATAWACRSAGAYDERINTDSAHYGGSNVGNGGHVLAEAQAWMGFPASLTLTLPPLAALVLLPE
jgi:1,4-alpha-glucan branching enzyme